MKRTSLLFIPMFILIFNATGQKLIDMSKFNLGFEKAILLRSFPDFWIQTGEGYTVAIDTVITRSGKRAVRIESSPAWKSGSSCSLTNQFPAILQGEEIELKAWLKTRGMKRGGAELVLRIDFVTGESETARITGRKVPGTSGWTQYTLKMPLSELAKKISFGAALTGSGQLWADDFEINIDGKSILMAKYIQYGADKDREFDLGSRVGIFTPSGDKIQDLKVLGMVWGFLKYYHPAIAKGNFNWDYELFRLFPQIIACENSTVRDQILAEWITNLGDFKLAEKTDEIAAEVKIKPDLEWISDPVLSPGLRSGLLKVKNAFRVPDNYYLGLYSDAGNAEMKNERTYSEMKYPDAGFRLLSLYRYWNIIQYYYPYKNLFEEDWKDVLAEFIPKYLGASNQMEYNLVVLELIVRIHDTHAGMYPQDASLYNYNGKYYLPANLSFVENKAVITSFSVLENIPDPGLKIGDVILRINGLPVDDMVRDKLKYTPGSNYPVKLRNIADNLLRTNNPLIKIEFERDGIVQEMDFKTCPMTTKVISRQYPEQDTCFKMLRPDIGYIFPGYMKNKYLPEMMEKIGNAAGLIIDFRCYPSDFLVHSLGDYLVPESTEFVKLTNGSIVNPGLFTINRMLSFGKTNSDYFKGKVVILVNENTQSQAEFTTMALGAAPNATIIGSVTSGADGNVTTFMLPGGITTKMSGIGIYYPDGRETQRVGIVPDIELRPTIRGIRAGKDELLLKAIEIID